MIPEPGLFDIEITETAYGRQVRYGIAEQPDVGRRDDVVQQQDVGLHNDVGDDGRAARDHALEVVEEAGDDWDRSVVDRAIVETGKRLGEFSANDVRPLLPEVRRSLVGARFLAMAKAGRLESVGYVASSDAGTHASPIRLWEWVG
jgi:hypothetical protein